MDISKTIFSDPINKWVFSNAKTEVFLVGGYVRDLLRGQISKDKDFVLGFACGEKNAVENIAIETAKKFNGTFIALKPQQTYRVVLKKSKEVLDFSSLKVSINNDLKKRDFTINAIAWSPKTGIIDPFGGREDLNNHIIKAVRMKNLTEDPLRVIRAYRIAAELGFKIENRTRKCVKRYSKGLTKVSLERITEELFKILNNENAVGYLNKCYKDRVLEKILSSRNRSSESRYDSTPRGRADQSIRTTGNVIKKVDTLSKNVKLLNKFDLFLKTQLVKINKSPVGISFRIDSDDSYRKGKKIAMLLKEEISQGLNRLGLMRLALLLKDSSILHSRLRVSRNINKAVRDIHNGYAIAMHKILATKLYKIFNASGDRVFETAIFLSFIKRKNVKEFFKRANEYTRVKSKILLNGNDVQKILNIKPGTKVGEILLALQEQQFEGLIKTKTEAKKWLLRNFT